MKRAIIYEFTSESQEFILKKPNNFDPPKKIKIFLESCLKEIKGRTKKGSSFPGTWKIVASVVLVLLFVNLGLLLFISSKNLLFTWGSILLVGVILLSFVLCSFYYKVSTIKKTKLKKSSAKQNHTFEKDEEPRRINIVPGKQQGNVPGIIKDEESKRIKQGLKYKNALDDKRQGTSMKNSKKFIPETIEYEIDQLAQKIKGQVSPHDIFHYFEQNKVKIKLRLKKIEFTAFYEFFKTGNVDEDLAGANLSSSRKENQLFTVNEQDIPESRTGIKRRRSMDDLQDILNDDCHKSQDEDVKSEVRPSYNFDADEIESLRTNRIQKVPQMPPLKFNSTLNINPKVKKEKVYQNLRPTKRKKKSRESSRLRLSRNSFSLQNSLTTKELNMAYHNENVAVFRIKFYKITENEGEASPGFGLDSPRGQEYSFNYIESMSEQNEGIQVNQINRLPALKLKTKSEASLMKHDDSRMVSADFALATIPPIPVRSYRNQSSDYQNYTHLEGINTANKADGSCKKGEFINFAEFDDESSMPKMTRGEKESYTAFEPHPAPNSEAEDKGQEISEKPSLRTILMLFRKKEIDRKYLSAWPGRNYLRKKYTLHHSASKLGQNKPKSDLNNEETTVGDQTLREFGPERTNLRFE